MHQTSLSWGARPSLGFYGWVLAFSLGTSQWACSSRDGSNSQATDSAGGSGGAGGGAGSGGAGSGGTEAGGGSSGSTSGGGTSTTGSGGEGPQPSLCVNSATALETYAITEASPRVVIDEAQVFASALVENAALAVDGDTNPNTFANLGALDEAPQWIAVDLGADVEIDRLLLLFLEAGSGAYTSDSDTVAAAGVAPGAYTIETSADSSDGSDGEWELVAEVTDNRVRSRAHSFDFSGQRWVRFTAEAPGPNASVVRLAELVLHDISDASGERPQDSWLFFGDSISQSALRRALRSYSFENVVAAEQPGFEPIMLNASVGGEHLSDAIARLDSLFELNPDFQNVGIAYGTNDAWGNQNPESIGFRDELVQVVEAILAAERTPIIARIPYATAAHSTLPEFNAIIDEVQSEYDLPCGPDLHTAFEENPALLKDDGVHPTSNGDIEINALWAEAAAPLYQAE